MRLRLAAALVAGFAVLVPPSPRTARAQAATDVEKARELFREGVALMAAEDWAGALAKFKAVSRVKMSAQVAFNIAECEEKLGRLVAALGNYRVALGKAREPDANAPQVAEHAPERIAALEPRIGKLTILRKEEKPNPAALLELDGTELGSAQIGAALPVDPGERTVRIIVDGTVVGVRKITIGEGESKKIEILVPAPAEKQGAGPGPAPEGERGVSIPGAVLVAFGGASLVAGGVFIGLRQAAISELDELCGGDSSCPPSAESTYDQGRLYTGLAEGFIPAGVVSATIGIIFLSLGVSGERTEAAFFSPGDFGGGVRVRF